MRKLYFFTILSIITSLLIVFASQQICMPDGCFFAPQEQVCQQGNCMNEDVRDHFKERADFLLATMRYNQNFSQSLALFLVAAFLLNFKPQLSQLNLKFKSIIRNYASLHNRLIDLFAKGVLHPKIY